MRKCSRRGFAGSLLAAVFRPWRLKGQSAATATALAAAAPPGPGKNVGEALSRSVSRTYRADAVILLLGISIYRRAGVGSGRASLGETGEGASLRRALFFAGGSDPKRAHGLSRIGWMQEVVIGPASAPSEAAYFGVLTSSPEESLEHARKAVDVPPSGQSVFSAVSGRNSAGHSRSAVTHFDFAASALWSDRGLIDRAHATFDANADWRETSWADSLSQAPPTFLCQLETLMKQRIHRAAGRFVYSEQEYLLELEAQPSSRETDRLLPVRGAIHNLGTGRVVPFRMWLDDATDSIVPVRIEFQPRSFLRLTFEAVAG